MVPQDERIVRKQITLKVDIFLIQQGSNPGDRLVDHFDDGDRLDLDPQMTGVKAGDIGQILDQPAHAVDVTVDRRQEFTLPAGKLSGQP